MSTKMNALGYIRVSTEAQAGEDRFGVDAQKAAIIDYAFKHDYVVRDFVIDKISGVKDDRPGFSKILNGGVHTDSIDAVIIFKTDRLARDTKLYFYYLFCIERMGMKLLSTQEDFKEGDDFANIYRSLITFAAEQERKNITMRTMRGKREKAKNGGFTGGRKPYGYNITNKRLVVNDDEAEIVRLIFRLVDMGKTYLFIAQYLTELRIDTPSGKSRWSVSTIQSIRENRPLYEGMICNALTEDGTGEKTYVLGQHKAILDTVFDTEDPLGNRHRKQNTEA